MVDGAFGKRRRSDSLGRGLSHRETEKVLRRIGAYDQALVTRLLPGAMIPRHLLLRRANLRTVRHFHSSQRRLNELPQSPFQKFVQVLREELQKNRELQDNVRQVQGDVDKIQDMESLKRAREIYERARVCPYSLCITMNQKFIAFL